MAVIETWFRQDLQKPVKVNYLDGNLFSNNGNGNRIGVVLTNNGEDLASISGTVSGYVVTADGSTVPCTGSKSGNRASILIPAAAYQPGSIFITVFVTDGTTVTTIGAVSTTVMRSRTNAQVDPGSTVTDWTQTINSAMQSVETAAANLGGIVATPYASLMYPVPLGKYTYYNGNLYRCISPIAASETFTPAHWTAVKLGDDVSDLKSALDKTDFRGDIFNEMFSDFDEGTYFTLNNSMLELHRSGNTRIYTNYIPCIIGCKISMNLTDSNYQYVLYWNDAGISGYSWASGIIEYTPTENGNLSIGFKKTEGNVSDSDISAISSAFTVKYYPNNVYTGLHELNDRIDDISDNVLYEFKNLFDDSTIVSGGYYSNSGTISSKSNCYYSTQMIPVSNGKKYIFPNITGSIYLYCGAIASNGTPYFVRRSSPENGVYTCPNDVSIIKISAYNGAFGSNAMCIEGTTEPPEYIEYNEKMIAVKQSAIFPEIEQEKKCKIIHKTGHIDYDHFNKIYDQEYLSIYIPTKTGYYEQTFAHCVNAERFADNWRLSIGFKTNDDLQRQYNVIVHGEFELAVALPKTSADSHRGYMGGIAHGYEKTDTNGLMIFVDGVKKSTSDLSSLVSFDRINIIEQSTLYDPDDTTESVAVHSREYVITKDGIRIIQSLKWLINNEITRCFMAMLPIAKTDNVDTSIVITDRFFSDVNAMPQTPDYSEGEQYIPDAQRVTMFSSDSNAMASLTCVEYPDNYVGGKTAFLTDNNGGAYNKLYFQISSSGGGNSVTAGTLWKSITEYVIRC